MHCEFYQLERSLGDTVSKRSAVICERSRNSIPSVTIDVSVNEGPEPAPVVEMDRAQSRGGRGQIRGRMAKLCQSRDRPHDERTPESAALVLGGHRHPV